MADIYQHLAEVCQTLAFIAKERNIAVPEIRLSSYTDGINLQQAVVSAVNSGSMIPMAQMGSNEMTLGGVRITWPTA